MDAAWAASLLTVVLLLGAAALRLCRVGLVAESALHGARDDVSVLRVRARPRGATRVAPRAPRATRARTPRPARPATSLDTHELLGLLLALGYGDGHADGHLANAVRESGVHTET